MRRTSVPSGGAELAATEWGQEGPPVLALHPGVGDSRIWQWCAPAWAEAGHRVIAFDRRGYGTSRYVEEHHDDLVDLLAVTAATASRPAVMVGNSLGGGLALDVALAHPNHVLGLVLVSPSPSGYPYEDWPTSEAEADQDRLVEAASDAGDIDLVNRLEVRYWLDGAEQPEGRVKGEARELMAEMNSRALWADPVGESAERGPAWPRIGEIAAPTLVVAGEHDLPGVVQTCERLAEAVPGASLSMVRGSAHCPSLDQPEQLNRLVIGFLHSLAR